MAPKRAPQAALVHAMPPRAREALHLNPGERVPDARGGRRPAAGAVGRRVFDFRLYSIALLTRVNVSVGEKKYQF